MRLDPGAQPQNFMQTFTARQSHASHQAAKPGRKLLLKQSFLEATVTTDYPDESGVALTGRH